MEVGDLEQQTKLSGPRVPFSGVYSSYYGMWVGGEDSATPQTLMPDRGSALPPWEPDMQHLPKHHYWTTGQSGGEAAREVAHVNYELHPSDAALHMQLNGAAAPPLGPLPSR